MCVPVITRNINSNSVNLTFTFKQTSMLVILKYIQPLKTVIIFFSFKLHSVPQCIFFFAMELPHHVTYYYVHNKLTMILIEIKLRVCV